VVAAALAYTLGWRMQSEVLALERRHVDLEAGTLRLDPGMAKNDDARVVYLTADLIDGVRAQLARVETLQRATGAVVPYLFPHLRGRHRGHRILDFVSGGAQRAGTPGVRGCSGMTFGGRRCGTW
jgi:integrase